MANRMLLTGAGFTHNFGAPLASEVFNLIFNSVSGNSQLLDLLRYNFDYEDAYQSVMQSKNYDLATKQTFTSALTEAYDIINKLINNKNDPRIYYFKLHGSQDWFKDDSSQMR